MQQVMRYIFTKKKHYSEKSSYSMQKLGYEIVPSRSELVHDRLAFTGQGSIITLQFAILENSWRDNFLS